jgi:hypothetical protein
MADKVSLKRLKDRRRERQRREYEKRGGRQIIAGGGKLLAERAIVRAGFGRTGFAALAGRRLVERNIDSAGHMDMGLERDALRCKGKQQEEDKREAGAALPHLSHVCQCERTRSHGNKLPAGYVPWQIKALQQLPASLTRAERDDEAEDRSKAAASAILLAEVPCPYPGS